MSDRLHHVIWGPGPHYLAARNLLGWNFYWTKEKTLALHFADARSAEGVLEALRPLNPALFAFAAVLGDPQIVQVLAPPP